MGERLACTEEVVGSTPTGSINKTDKALAYETGRWDASGLIKKHSERLLTLISNSTVSDSNIMAVIVQVGGVSHIYAGMAQLAEQLTCQSNSMKK